MKQVPDTTTKIVVREDQNGIKEDGVKFVVSPYDEFAIEEAIRLKEKQGNSEVVVFSLGPKRAQEALRSALAMGCDRAVHVVVEKSMDTLGTAKVLAKALEKEGVEIVFTGRHAVDDDAGQVSQMIAEKLSWPHVSIASRMILESGSTKALIERDIDGGAKEVWSVQLPAVIAANKGLNEPRYASLKGIMAAKSKPLAAVTPEELGISGQDLEPKVIYSKFTVPSESRKTKVLKGLPADQAVKEVVRLLREEAKVI